MALKLVLVMNKFPSHTGQASYLVAQSLGATGAH